MHPFPTLCEGMLGNSLASLFFLHTMKMNSAHAIIIMCSREERKSYRLASTGWVNEVFLQCRMKSLTHISPRLYTNIMLDLLRTNCLPLWCLWRHDTPLTRVSVCVCVCARSSSHVNAVGFVWVSVFCLWNVGVVPTRFTNNRPVQTVRAWQRMSHQPKQRTHAHSTVFDPLLEENPPYRVESGRGVITRSPIYLGSSTTFLQS